MKQSMKHLFLLMLVSILFVLCLPTRVWANAAEPPSLLILVNNPPEDLSIVIVTDEGEVEASVRRVAWEEYHLFYSSDMRNDSEYTFRVTTGGESFEETLDLPMDCYNNVFTLNLAKQTFTAGVSPLRSILLISIRVLLTLLLEAIVFWMFGFRTKREWLVFFAINLVTQGILNIWLNGGNLLQSYLIIQLIFGEVFVFIAEMIAFPVFIKDRKKGVVILYALVANLLSLFLGGFIITALPV